MLVGQIIFIVVHYTPVFLQQSIIIEFTKIQYSGLLNRKKVSQINSFLL